ncbi:MULTISPECIES: hypothetical protein [unclassified Bradyrhizobium]|uniref:hypothetical protein n=1 Tax=unclassified Bradyrhizobium TaxID=2631580 RepID=UPI0023026D04|nr:hypothetical protein [Bradyrhizobium sp. CCBAU 25338]
MRPSPRRKRDRERHGFSGFAGVSDSDAPVLIKPEIEMELQLVGTVCSPWLTFVGINIQIELEKIR